MPSVPFYLQIMVRLLFFIHASVSALLRPMAPPRRLHSIAPKPGLHALPAREASREVSHLVLTSAATNDDTTAEPPEEKQEPVWKKFGEAGVIAYVGINVFWYAIGVNLFLRGMPIKQAGGARLAYKRFLAAWGLCFAASHSLGPVLPAVRAAGAGALSPLSSALLKRVRRRLPASTPRWVAPSLAFVGLCALFGLLSFFTLTTELVRVAAAA